jgi:hypothetical protein
MISCAALACNLAAQGGSLYASREKKNSLLALCLSTSVACAAFGGLQGYRTGAALGWANLGVGLIAPAIALVQNRDQVRESLWGEGTEFSRAEGPLANLWHYWGEGFEEKSRALAFFIVGVALPLATQKWIFSNPTLTVAITTVAAAAGGTIWNRQKDDEGASWNNGICNPLFLGAMSAVAGLNLWQLSDYLSPLPLPFWSVERLLQLITLGFSGLVLGSELVIGAKKPASLIQ